MPKIILDSGWSEVEPIQEFLTEHFLNTSKNQRDLLTPIFINSTTLEILKDAYTQLFKQTGNLYTPLAFRYSYAFRVQNKNVMATTKYHLEKDFNLMLNKYKIVTHTETLKLTGAKWEREAYEQLKWFTGDAVQAVNKLITCKGKDNTYLGWYFKELFPDNPVR